jgi:hypothetical protein
MNPLFSAMKIRPPGAKATAVGFFSPPITVDWENPLGRRFAPCAGPETSSMAAAIAASPTSLECPRTTMAAD